VAGVLLFAFALLALDADESAEQDGNSEIACRCKELLVLHGLHRRSFMVSPVGADEMQ